MPYEIGKPELDGLVRQLVETASDNQNGDLISEVITTAVRLHRDNATRGDLKLINTALKEMRYSSLVFSRHDEPKVTLYGSARVARTDPNYLLARDFAAEMASRGWGVVTGAGPGIMEAGNLGAGIDHSYGVSIRLPFETSGNAYLSPARTVNFKYFFTRKLGFVKESHAFALFPGGFGTLDETFELLTLVQTGKSDLHPIVLVEAPGTGYWEPLLDFFSSVLIERGMISPEDTSLFLTTTSHLEAVEEICGFYANYHSQRYVDGTLVLRLAAVPSSSDLASLSEEFADIITEGTIQSANPSPAEVADSDAIDLRRIAFRFDRRSYGRLRQLINRLNRLVEPTEHVQPPAPFGPEQADRAW
jgi:uncharacterized protein (TIGR00730 family)